MQLLHRLIPQHIPNWRPAPLPLQDRHVRLGAAVWLPLCRRWALRKDDMRVLSLTCTGDILTHSNWKSTGASNEINVFEMHEAMQLDRLTGTA